MASSVALIALTASSGWAGVTEEISTLQKRWAEINYQMEGDAQSEAFASLATEADAVVSKYPDNAAPLIWRGIIKSTYAGAKGGLGALSLVKHWTVQPIPAWAHFTAMYRVGQLVLVMTKKPKKCCLKRWLSIPTE